MAERIDKFTPAQIAQLGAHADRWIEIALRTAPIPRRALTKIARRSCEWAGLPWHDNVIIVSSPLVLTLAAPIAAFLIPWQRKGLPDAAVNGAVGAAVGAAVRAAVDPLAEPTAAPLRASVRAAIHAAVKGACGGPAQPVVRLQAQVNQAAAGETRGRGDRHDAALHRDFAKLLSPGVCLALDGMSAAVDGATAGAFAEVRMAAGQAVHAAALAAGHLQDTLGAGQQLASSFAAADLPFHSTGWAACMSFLREVGDLTLRGELSQRALAYEQMAELAAWWYPHPDFLMVSERPGEIHRELADRHRPRGLGSHRLHRIEGPAICWRDGWTMHMVHGRRVPGWIVEHPERITVAAIDETPNAEVRRVMLERYGWARYMQDSNAAVVDECGADHPVLGLRGARLLRKQLPGEPEPMVWLEMVNSTPEPDGTYKRYLERIDPKVYGGDAGRLCHAAAASRWYYRNRHGQRVRTFVRWQDYLPVAES